LYCASASPPAAIISLAGEIALGTFPNCTPENSLRAVRFSSAAE
jgi:hypothetical protein